MINNRPVALAGLTARVSIYNLDGTLASQHEVKVNAGADAVTNPGPVEFPSAPAPVYFLRLELLDATGNTISQNFYWLASPAQLGYTIAPGNRPADTVQAQSQQANSAVASGQRPVDTVEAQPEGGDDLTALNKLPMVTLVAAIQRADSNGNCTVTVTLRNVSPHIALMAHLQLRCRKTGERVLPAYASDNYVSWFPNKPRRSLSRQRRAICMVTTRLWLWMDGM